LTVFPSLVLAGAAPVVGWLTDQRLLGWIGCGLGLALAVVCCVLLWGATLRRKLAAFGLVALGYAGVIAAFVLLPRGKGSLPADLALVPPDAIGFVSVRLGDVWNSEDAADLRKMAKDHPLAGSILKELEEKTGLTLADVERFVVLILEVNPESTPPIGTITTVKPFNRDKLLPALVPDAKERKVGDKVYFTSGMAPLAVHFVDDHTLVLGPAPKLESFLGKVPAKRIEGPLTDPLREASGKHAVVLGFNPGALPAALKQQVPLQAELFRPLLDAKAATLTLDLDKNGVDLGLRFAFANEDEGKKGEEALGKGLELAKVVLPPLIEGMIKGPKNPALESALRALKDFQTGLQAAKVQRDGKSVQVAIKVQTPNPLNALVGAALQINK
jgi:hypothetical protein